MLRNGTSYCHTHLRWKSHIRPTITVADWRSSWKTSVNLPIHSARLLMLKGSPSRIPDHSPDTWFTERQIQISTSKPLQQVWWAWEGRSWCGPHVLASPTADSHKGESRLARQWMVVPRLYSCRHSMERSCPTTPHPICCGYHVFWRLGQKTYLPRCGGLSQCRKAGPKIFKGFLWPWRLSSKAIFRDPHKKSV